MAADRLDAYANWIKSNVDKKGTPEFEKVATAYKKLRSESLASKPASSDAIPTRMKAPEPTALETGGRIAAGLLTGAATIPEILLSPTGLTERGRTEEAFRQLMNIPEDSMAFGGGKIGGEVLATMGVPVAAARTAGRVLPAAAKTPYVNKLLSAIETGGFGKMAGAPAGAPMSAQAVQAAQNYMTRVAGGAIGGGITGAALQGDLEGAGEGALIGGAVPAAVRLVAAPVGAVAKRTPGVTGYLAEKFYQLKNPEKAALVNAAGSKIDEIISALGTEGAIVPGTQVSAGEAAAKAGSTGFSALVAKMFKDVPEMADILQEREATNMLARDLYNRGIFQSAQQAEQSLIDAAGAAGLEARVVGGMGQRMAAEQQRLSAEQEQIASGVKQPSQMDVGKTVKTERDRLVEEAQKNVIDPLYAKAKEYSEPFDVSEVQKVSNSVARANTRFSQDLNPDVVALIDQLQPKVSGGGYNPLTLGFEPPVTTPPAINMNQAVELNKALNREYARLKGSDAPGVAQTISGINKIRAALKDAIKNNVPEEFSNAFEEANKSFRTLVAEPFKKSEFEKLNITSTGDQALLKGSDVSDRILSKPEYAQQFVAQMKNSPESLQAAMDGIEGRFRDAAIKNGRIVPEKAVTFMDANREVLDVLQKGGMDIKSRLSGIVSQARDAELAAKLAEKTRKPLETFSTPEGLRSGLLKNPELMGDAFKYMGQEEAEGLSRGFLTDAFEDPSGASAYLMKNQKALKQVFEKSHPGKSDRMLLDAVNTANLYDETLKNQKLIGDLDPAKATAARQEKIAKLTEGLSPQQMRDVTAIQKDIARRKTFEELAKAGTTEKKNLIETLVDFSTPQYFSTAWTTAKQIIRSAGGKISEKKALELANAFLEPKVTRKVLQEAKAWQAETASKKAAAVAKTKKMVERGAEASGVTARAGVAALQNSMAESRNRNALNQ